MAENIENLCQRLTIVEDEEEEVFFAKSWVDEGLKMKVIKTEFWFISLGHLTSLCWSYKNSMEIYLLKSLHEKTKGTWSRRSSKIQKECSITGHNISTRTKKHVYYNHVQDLLPKESKDDVVDVSITTTMEMAEVGANQPRQQP
ncbi:hypothetical protein PTKIN_Ptkin03bG0135300 [Pterospermum kingtungense]